MAGENEHERREVYYFGRVQGVGFRYTARSLARRFEVAGFVRNLPHQQGPCQAQRWDGNPASADSRLTGAA